MRQLDWKVGVLGLAVLALIVGSIALAGVGPGLAAQQLWQGNFGSVQSINDLFKEIAPLLLLGAAVYVALKAGLFNIGAEGQFVVGAIACAGVALRFDGFPGIALGALAGCIAGAVWAWPAGWIRAYRGGHEVITTIMLNNVAIQITALLVAGPLKDPSQQGTTTRILSAETRLPNFVFQGVTINTSIVIGIGIAVLGAYWLNRFVGGYELRAVGANPVASTVAGISTQKVQLWSMVTSGAVAGLAGAFQVLAFEGRFFKDFSPGYGFDALGVALLAGPSMIGVIPAAIGFGILNNGRTALSIIGIPKGITSVILGLLIIVVASIRYRKMTSHE